MNNSRIFTIKNAKLSGNYLHMNLNIWRDFQICISVPLINNFIKRETLAHKYLKAPFFIEHLWWLLLYKLIQRKGSARCSEKDVFQSVVSNLKFPKQLFFTSRTALSYQSLLKKHARDMKRYENCGKHVTMNRLVQLSLVPQQTY